MMRTLTIVLAVGLVGSPAMASECSDARESYNQALSDVAYEVRRYTKCLTNSDGTDDCSSEFRRLKNEQDTLENAVSDIELYCEV